MSYADLLPLRLGGPLSRLEPLRPMDREHLTGSAPLAAYEDFLRMFGFGVIGADLFMLYSGLVEADWIWGREVPVAADLLMFGDDMAGRVSGIRLSDGLIFEFDSYGEDVQRVADDFEQFMRRMLREL